MNPIAELTFIGRHVHKIREMRGLTQRELGERALLSESTISLIETGARTMSLHALFRLADALRVEPEELVRTTKPRSHERGDTMNRQLEDTLLAHWDACSVTAIYKYKHRIMEFRDDPSRRVELFYDLTQGTLFQDVPDIASFTALCAEAAQTPVAALIEVRAKTNTPTNDPRRDGSFGLRLICDTCSHMYWDAIDTGECFDCKQATLGQTKIRTSIKGEKDVTT